MTSRFHREALRRLSLAYEADPGALRVLEDRARHLGRPLPASFVEWYGMRRGPALLRQNSNCDAPVEVARLGEPCEWRWEEARDLVREGLLLFMVENQAVSVWAVRLDAGDDPPVVVARDPDLQWRECAERFSTFIESQVWDHTEVLDATSRRILLQAQDVPLEGVDLAFLRQQAEGRTCVVGPDLRSTVFVEAIERPIRGADEDAPAHDDRRSL